MSDSVEAAQTNAEITLDTPDTNLVILPGRGGRWVSWQKTLPGGSAPLELFGNRGSDPRPLRIDSGGHAGPLVAPGLGPAGPAGMIDHFMPLTSFQSDFAAGRAREIGSFSTSPFEYEKYGMGRGGWETAMFLEGAIKGARRAVPVRMYKKIAVQPGESEISVHYRIENPDQRPLQILFGIEFSFALAPGSEGYYEIDGQREGGGFAARGVAPEVTTAALIEPQPGLSIRMGWEREATIWVCPSPAGSEGDDVRGATVMPVWDLRVPPEDNWAVGIWLQAGASGPVQPFPPEVIARIRRYESDDEPWPTAADNKK